MEGGNTMNFASYCIETVCTGFFQNINNKKTQGSYLYALKEFFEKYPEYEDFSYTNCSNYLEYLQYEKKQKYSTVVKKKKQLCSFFNYIDAHLDQYNDIPPDFLNYFNQVSLPEEPEIIHANRIISVEDLDILITYLQSNNLACMVAVALAFKLMLKTSEIIGLQWRDVIETKDGYLLRLQDGNENRYIALPEDVFNVMMAYEQTVTNSLFVFPSPRNNDTHISSKGLIKWLDKAEKETKLLHYTFNDLRNAGISYAVSQKCSVELLTQQLNFKSRSHITRLTSVSSLSFPNASEYTNVVFKGTTADGKEDDTPIHRIEEDSTPSSNPEQLIKNLKESLSAAK